MKEHPVSVDRNPSPQAPGREGVPEGPEVAAGDAGFAVCPDEGIFQGPLLYRLAILVQEHDSTRMPRPGGPTQGCHCSLG